MAHSRMGEREELPQSAVSQIAPAAGSSSSSSKYQLLMELGRGGTAVVYAALARGLGGFSKLVVLKVTRQELADHPEAVRMFLNEARLSARMNHPNVVQVYEVVEDQGLPVIVMEYLEGQSFAMILRNLHRLEEYPVNLALSVLCKALEGLHYAHSLSDFSGRPLKIIHRDVTPHNIMVTYDGQVKLLDFGIAKLDASNGQTKTGIIKGKLAYMPREQIDGSEMDCRSDVFAIGVILWEVVAAQRMWGTLSDATVMKNLLCNDIPRLRDAKPDVHPELEQIINKAIAPEPEGRYSSAHELLVALSGHLEAQGGMATQGEIAELVNRTCGDLKEHSKKRLDQELAKISQSADGSWNDDVPAEFTGSGPKAAPEISYDGISRGRLPHDTLSRTGFTGQAESGVPARKRWTWPLGAAIATVGVLAAAAMALMPSAASQPERAPSAAPPGANAPAAAPAATIRVLLGAVPDHAALYLDGARLASNPFTTSMPADQREHELRITASGFVPVTRSVRFDRDVEIQLSLEAVPPAPTTTIDLGEDTAPARAKTARKVARGKPRPAASAKPAEAPAGKVAVQPASKPAEISDACNPPYVVNELGVKRYKRECLQ
jgi:eukaryotic-like serine/threonine-protein kinase